MFYTNSCSEKFKKFLRKPPWCITFRISLTKTLYHGYFLGNVLKYFRQDLSKNTSARLLRRMQFFQSNSFDKQLGLTPLNTFTKAEDSIKLIVISFGY